MYTHSDNNISYNFNKANLNYLHSYLLNADWDTLEGCTEVNELCNNFYNKLKSIFDRCVPQYIPNKTSNFPLWYNRKS